MNEKPECSPPVCVVIPNKNGAFHLQYSLPSLRRTVYENYRIVIVDNGSTDQSLSIARELCPEAKIIVNPTDVGFAGSLNNGIRYAFGTGAKYVAIFSNDIKVLPDWLDFALSVFVNQTGTGLVGFNEVPREREELFLNPNYRADVVKSGTDLPGCLLVCEMGVFLRIGLLDEGYFLYGEDNDLFSRVTKAGYKILQTEMPVWHYGEGASVKRRFLPAWLAYRNALRFAIKNLNLQGVTRMSLALLYHGCFARRGESNMSPSINRLRRYGRFGNLFLFLGSCVWNLFFLPKTLWSRFFFPGPRLNQ